ncbi:MAG: endolytic transglycosylase MltG [Clostridia bacterium]|nr:endolytic transglycosylase MltG [Clostridia bacterium]
MKKIIPTAIVIAFLLFSMPAITEYFNTNSTAGNSITVEIPQGATVDTIADILHEAKLINSKTAFKLRVKLSGYGSKLNYGTYTLDDGMALRDVIEYLGKSGNQNTVSLVVPEGFSVENISDRVDSLGLCSKDDFLRALEDDYDYEFIQYIPSADYNYKLQGFLFPDTYSFLAGTDAHSIVDAMLANFDKQYKNNIGAYDNSLFETITKAALVEKEAKLEYERAAIAGVIQNRLAADMPLQIDAAIVYAVSDGTFDVTGVSYSNLEVDSPYNIYVNRGLTPGPICNPGISSIKAALNPQKHEYLYYHTDTEKNDGSHIFTETYEQHLETMN